MTVRKDKVTAERLKPWYGQFCKRPCFHDEYLEAFNSPNTHLIDTDGRGVDRVTESGIIAAGAHYPLDCIIYASGFESGTPYCDRAGFDVIGRDAVRLSERWANGVLSLHGIHVHGFPNLFVVDPVQGANLLSNITHNIIESARTIAATVRHALDTQSKEVEVTSEAESDWVNMLLKDGGRKLGSSACTPGKYNYEGSDIGRAALLNAGYPAGPLAFFQYIDHWRKSGRYDGLVFR
jgi:cyclohexanone monooxygenase